MEEKVRIYYTKDGWVCERFPYDLPIDDEGRYMLVGEDDYEKTLGAKTHFAWRVVDGELTEERYEETPAEETLENLRNLREEICFPVINRGQMWHDSLTAEQRQELQDWYKAWLDVTETMEEPLAPEWLFSNQNKKENEQDGTNQDSAIHEQTTSSDDAE